ncbi:MAG: integrase domain-containing protein [Proteobacteria bacterium]|nr:integrase domain-containing protein [Pseudomonadota bacterium]
MSSRRTSPAFMAELDRIIDVPNRKAYNDRGNPIRDCAQATRDERRRALHQVFCDLRGLGYRLPSPLSLRTKHVEALTELWLKKKQASRSIHTQLSMLRVFCHWIKKPNLVGDIDQYFEPEQVHRSLVCTVNKAWQPNGIDVPEVIAKAKAMNAVMGILLELQDKFGLRTKESIELSPATNYDRANGLLHVVKGTKGGKPRVIVVETAEQRQVLEAAIQLSLKNGDRMRWARLTWKQAQRRFYYYCEKLGITREELGVTAHGLRHGYLQDAIEEETGFPPPIKGGALGKIDAQTYRAALHKVARAAGHGRIDVMCLYAGSYGYSLRKFKTPADLPQQPPRAPSQEAIPNEYLY